MVVIALVSVVAITGARGASASPTSDLSGVWTIHNTTGPGAGGTLDITDGVGGAFNGTGYGGGWVVHGSVSGNSVRYTVSGQGSYESTVVGTLSSDGARIVYSWNDTNGASGTAYLERAGGAIEGRIQLESGCSPGPCALKPLRGATVNASGSSGSGSASTGANGTYSIKLPAGTYTVTPTYKSKEFTPASRTLTVSSSTVSGVDFKTCAGTSTNGPGSRTPGACEHKVTISVDYPDKGPAKGVIVKLHEVFPRAELVSGKTDKNGDFSAYFAPGTVYVSLLRPDGTAGAFAARDTNNADLSQGDQTLRFFSG